MTITLDILKKTNIKSSVKPKKNLNEKVGAFSVLIDNIDDANFILNKATSLGISSPKTRIITPKIGVSTLAFFFEGTADIKYVATYVESILSGHVPVLSASADKWDIVKMIRLASEEKRKMRSTLNVRGKTLRELYILKKEAKKNKKKGANYLIDYFTTPIPEYKDQEVNIDKHIEVWPHFIQIGTNFVLKRPNDIVTIDV